MIMMLPFFATDIIWDYFQIDKEGIMHIDYFVQKCMLYSALKAILFLITLISFTIN